MAQNTDLHGVAILTGVGFSISLFIGTLASEGEQFMAQVRLGVLSASIVSGLAQWLMLSLVAQSAEGRAARPHR
ncbi:hypothetical protein GCM10007874_26380 [Labrys miyagiensis]|uniref:Putative Na(+)/H(+) antiporter NhaA homolog n=1 Tax=Labrys miyagiensis TaxID=346912 RepID=A0ABQ6CHD9_9HYPH|nr:Na+/H+ antiporter NhaA [Labrys miyagiensis]GLS19621.1 hypothetical protein GCM10007874_26380 [Labrys miyagiensis]